jgi:ATP-binding cassette subfamily F protein 3
MVLLTLEAVFKAYGDNDILSGISWQLTSNSRVGLVGRNGCGKTTLFHLLAGRMQPDRGSVHTARGVRIAHLTQDPELPAGATVQAVLLEGFRELLDIRQKLRDLEEKMGDSGNPNLQSVMDQYARLSDTFEKRGGYALESKAAAILHGLGFSEERFDHTVDDLSGGEKNRLALGRLLAAEPDLMLLDEPTNHLDLTALEWLESYLASTRSAYLVVSHDRVFLDRAVTDIAELEQGRLRHFKGGYSTYALEKARQDEHLTKAYNRQKEAISRTEAFIRKNIAGQKTKQAQSRRKTLEKLERVDRPKGSKDMRLAFKPSKRGGNRIVQAEAISKSLGGEQLFKNLDLLVWRGDRLGVVGPNGSGKTTLIRILVGQMEADGGRVTMGTGIHIGYYSQDRRDLNLDRTLLEEVWSVTPNAPEGEIRNILGQFLFSGDDVERKVGDLSGGEQSRIALAKLMRSSVNLLVLDEPTNHLDIPSRTVLEESLETYEGTFITVSHDRWFLSRLADRMLVVEEGESQMVEGGWEAYEGWREERALRKTEGAAGNGRGNSVHQASRQNRKEEDRITRRKEARREAVEKEIADLEEALETLRADMADEKLATDWPKLEELETKAQEMQNQIDRLYTEWNGLDPDALPAEDS